jgi:hypothetical protein
VRFAWKVDQGRAEIGVFEGARENVLRAALPPDDAAALHRAAQSRGVEDTELVREWLSDKLHAI